MHGNAEDGERRAAERPGRALLSALWSRVGSHEIPGRAAQMSFYFLLAVIPMLLAFVGLVSLFDLQAQMRVFEDLTRTGLPDTAAALILRELSLLPARTGWPLLFSLALAFYYAGQGLVSVLRGIELSWGIRDTRPVSVQLQGLGLVGAVLAGLLVLLLVLTSVSWVIMWTSNRGWLPRSLGILVQYFRWPILVLLFQQVVNITYRIGARGRVAWGWLSWGSCCATVLWIAVSQGFEVYIRNVVDLGATYGSLGAVIGFLLYVHLVSVAVLLGSEIDALRADS